MPTPSRPHASPLELEIFLALCQKYTQRPLAASQGQVMTAETHELAAFIAETLHKALRGSQHPVNQPVRPP